MTRRRYGQILICPKHSDQELQNAGGEHHPPNTGWCKKCKRVVQGGSEPDPREILE